MNHAEENMYANKPSFRQTKEHVNEDIKQCLPPELVHVNDRFGFVDSHNFG